MQVCCLGGAGRICREAALDMLRFSECERLTLADIDERAGSQVVEWLGDPRAEFRHIDVREEEAAVAALAGYDVVMDGTAISLNDVSTRCIARAGSHGINLNGFGKEYAYDAQFKRAGRVHVPGFGMTPGTTNMMAVQAAQQVDTVDSVRVSHGAFRPIAFSRSIAETTTYEYDPALPDRVVFEDGEFVKVPPFARPRAVALPQPYGTHTQYIIPHSETRTLAEFLADRGLRLIEVRGTWPPANMRLIRALHEWGLLQNPRVEMAGGPVGVLDVIAEYLVQSEIGTTTELYGYALHVELEGTRDGQLVRHTLTHTHPPSDGSVPEWAGLRAYTRNVGIPMAIGAQLIAGGRIHDVAGVVIPERVFRPADVFAELARRDIRIHHRVEPIEEPPKKES
jgi:saccharopine dehydrogenase-like NADP-dependent oxidoreductase